MKAGERLLNVAASLSLLSWAGLGFYRAAHDGHLSVVRICISVLNVVVGIAFATRLPLRQSASRRELIKTSLSFVVGGLVFKFAPEPYRWSWPATVLFSVGTMLAITSLIALGRSFAILPGLRKVVVRGPYRWVRHPTYLGELGLIGACVMAGPDLRIIAAALLSVVAVVIRIRSEERLLAATPEYRRYAKRVPYRLIPGLW